MTYRNKYYTSKSDRTASTASGPGRHKNPNKWLTGPDPIEHDKYYAWLKHKAQAKHRGESYSLTYEEWAELWTLENWLRRGRGKEDLCLMQLSPGLGWHIGNVEVTERYTYLLRGSEYRNK